MNNYKKRAKSIFFSFLIDNNIVEGLSKDEFFNCVSMPRNRELIRIFKDLDLVEHIASDTGKIMTVYNKNSFEFIEHFLRISIPFEQCYENN